MSNSEYKSLIKKVLPKSNILKKACISFLVGGFIGVLAQVLVNFYTSFDGISKNNACNLMMVTIIFFSSLFTALGFFDDLVFKAGAGLIIPITGFSHSTTSSALEYRKEGLVYGIGANIFKLSGSVILYGVVSAYVFAIIRYILFGG